MKREYLNELGALRWTDEGKRALVRAMTQGEGKAAPRPRRAFRAALLTAALACLLTVGVGAALITLPVLRTHFGGGGGYDQAGALVGKSVTDQGWTMTLTDCVGDERYLVLGLELTAPEGTVLDREDYRFLRDHPEFLGQAKPSAWQMRQLEDGDPEDNRLRFGLWIENIQNEVGDPGLNGETMELRLQTLQYPFWDPDRGEWTDVTVFDGEWDFGRLTLSYPDRALRLEPHTPVTVLDVPAQIAYLEVTPIGLNVWFVGDALKDHDGRLPWPGQCVSEPEITLYDKEGNALIPDKYTPFGVRGGSGCNGNPNVPEQEYYFLNIIQSYGYLLDLDQLDHVEVCGVTIPLH